MKQHQAYIAPQMKVVSRWLETSLLLVVSTGSEGIDHQFARGWSSNADEFTSDDITDMWYDSPWKTDE